MVIDDSSKFCTSEFEYNSKEKEFTAEASSLFFGRTTRFSQLYNDACDVGITLVSNKTGNKSQFYLSYEHFRDGDLMYTELQPTQETTHNFPALTGSRITIFND